MAVLTLIPSQDGYSAKDAPLGVSSGLNGGLSRTRRDLLTATSRVEVMWKLDRTRYEALLEFYNTTTTRGSAAFQLDLIMDEPTLTRHWVNFIPGTLELASVEGATYVVKASLEVVPLAVNEAADEVIMDLFETFGSPESEELLAAIAVFVNETMPEYMG